MSAPRTMRAVVAAEGTDQRRPALRELPTPKPAPDEAIIAPLAVAITHLDLEASTGEPDRTLGHSCVARVIEPPTAHDDLEGAIAVVDPVIVDPGSPYAARGIAHHDPAHQHFGIRGRDGALAERAAVPINNLHVLPESLPEEFDPASLALAAPASVALAAAHHAQPIGGGYVTVLGDSLVALLAAQLLAADTVSLRLIHTKPPSGELAERWGIKARPASDIGLRADQRVVITTPRSLALALRMLEPRGLVILVPGPAIGNEDHLEALRLASAQEAIVRWVRAGSIGESITRLAAGHFDTAALLTDRYPLDRAPDAFGDLASGRSIAPIIELA